MIRSKEEKPSRSIEIDLTGPEGNAFVLMQYATKLGLKLGYSPQRVTAIRKVMGMGDYEGLVKVFDREFGHIVTLWKQAIKMTGFDQQTADDIFDDFMMNRASQAALFADFVELLNMKAAANTENSEKMEILTEILNDLKLFARPAENSLSH